MFPPLCAALSTPGTAPIGADTGTRRNDRGNYDNYAPAPTINLSKWFTQWFVSSSAVYVALVRTMGRLAAVEEYEGFGFYDGVPGT